ncbi:thioesterase family protein [Sphingomonas lacunae]|uniref:Thioesterase family protein n=1 Tax=Sphingomonas lacunae TaxID=2698828 RepID=A0A6M4B108_9SPHN|nr:thioesterase family protein [Sphingomonas lacunae]QJQ33041.1 thioesterase family protein [Sphingomonas lacunae]
MSSVTPAFFTAEGDHFVPQREAANPWFDHAVAGGPISGLFGHIAEQRGLIGEGFAISRMTIDILGIVPSAPLTATIEPVRIGRQVRLNRINLKHDNHVVAQALVQAARLLDTPPALPSNGYPAPEDVAPGTFLANGSLQRIVRTRPLQGSVTRPGPGQVWLALDADIVSGTLASPFVKSCVFADFGNGVGSATRAAEWSFANLDVGIHFLRDPHGEWILVDADTIAGGNGHGLARSTMVDAEGVFAIATQTVFVAPGSLTPRMEANARSAVG